MRRFVHPLALAVVVASMVIFVVSLPATYRGVLEPCNVDPDLTSEQGVEECENWGLTEAQHVELESHGISSSSYTLLAMLRELLIVLLYVAVGLVLLVRRRDDWFAAFTAAVLVSFGMTSFGSAVFQLIEAGVPPWVEFGARTLQFIGGAGLLVVLWLFPTGTFVPKWTTWLAPLWVFYEFDEYMLPPGLRHPRGGTHRQPFHRDGPHRSDRSGLSVPEGIRPRAAPADQMGGVGGGGWSYRLRPPHSRCGVGSPGDRRRSCDHHRRGVAGGARPGGDPAVDRGGHPEVPVVGHRRDPSPHHHICAGHRAGGWRLRGRRNLASFAAGNPERTCGCGVHFGGGGVVQPKERRRVHAFVDRRFDRTHYKAAQVVEGFSVRLRQDLDLDGLTDDLRGVVVATLRPSMTSVWLAATGRTPDGW